MERKDGFEILGLNEDATTEEVQEAYERKAAQYSSNVYDEDPKYVKKQLKVLKAAYEEAYQTAEVAALRAEIAAEKEQEEPPADIHEDPEKYMQQLYRKQMAGRIGRWNIIPPTRSKKQSDAQSAYKRSVLLFWTGILAVIAIFCYFF